MQRKIACISTAAMTVIFMIVRLVNYLQPTITIGSFSLADCLIGVSLVLFAVIAVLCFSKKPAQADAPPRASFLGWIATFCGAMLIMSTVLDTFCWMVYDQVPPPNDQILNNIDYYTLVLSLVFGTISGVYLMLQGFGWMANTKQNRAYLKWLSLAPILWMWFRLARYEISYASTIDISYSFFDFATLVTTSLFFLYLAKANAEMDEKPKNDLLIVFALFTTLCSVSGIPLTFYKLSHGETINALLIAIVDAAIGLLALSVVFQQLFFKKCETESDDAYAWTTPTKEHKPLDPPFSIDEKLPVIDDSSNVTDENVKNTPVSSKLPTDNTPSVDDILAELHKTI